MEQGRQHWNQKFVGSVGEWKIDYPPEQLFKEHRLPKPVGKTILDFGTGRGDFARFCKALGNTVISMDVADEALKGVEGVSDVCLLYDKDIDNLPPVDLAVANLVFQHCSDEVVAKTLKSIKLKPKGVLSFQYAEMLSPYVDWVTSQVNTGYLTFRSPVKMRQMVADSGVLKIESESGPIGQPWPGITMVHYFMQCVSK